MVRALLVLGLVLVLATAVALFRGARAVNAALEGKRALLAAERDLRAAKTTPARDHLVDAREAFARSRKELRGMGPILAVARVVPLVRVQVRGVEAFADAGRLLADAGIPIADAASSIVDPQDASVAVESALGSLQMAHASLRSGLSNLDGAIERVESLDGYRLLGPLSGARRDLINRLPAIRDRAQSAERGLGAVIAFAGGSGPRRYLVFSQNPDELRPTGGFMGTYGVLAAGSTKLGLERYDSIESWTVPRPEAVVSPEKTASVFRLYQPPLRQTLANVNASPDWPAASRLAMELWAKGGEQAVDGALSITPAFLARVVAVLGPVPVPGYDESVTGANVIERIDFHTHVADPDSAGRKDFVAAVAQAVMAKMLAAPAPQWHPLAQAVGAAFDAREAMVWSQDAAVTAEVAARRWDATLPDTFGDFFYDSEFEYEAKNGRGLKRTYDHRVELRANGSARITTSITIANTKPADPLNQHSVSFITLYGPRGAKLEPTSDPDEIPEPAVNGHPAAAWYRSADPLGTATLKIVWEAPSVARVLEDGSLEYGLWWMRIPDHSGDVLNLSVQPPPQWRWEGKAPPTTFALERDLVDTWVMVRGG